MEKAIRIYKAAAIGGVGYCLLEVLWRRYTHPSMALAGALSLCFIIYISNKYYDRPVYFPALLSALFITFIEFILGVIFNLFLKLNIWDYSDKTGNILGQICPLFFILWFMLSFIAIIIIRKFNFAFWQFCNRHL